MNRSTCDIMATVSWVYSATVYILIFVKLKSSRVLASRQCGVLVRMNNHILTTTALNVQTYA